MKTILIADDEEILRMLIADTLEDVGFQVEEAEDGQEALDKLINGTFDLLILDYMMPHLTGLEVLAKIKEAGKNVPVLMLTAKAQEADREQAIQQGADYFMSKPFSPADLSKLVETILA